VEDSEDGGRRWARGGEGGEGSGEGDGRPFGREWFILLVLHRLPRMEPNRCLEIKTLSISAVASAVLLVCGIKCGATAHVHWQHPSCLLLQDLCKSCVRGGGGTQSEEGGRVLWSRSSSALNKPSSSSSSTVQ